MAFDAFLKISSVPGESTDDKHSEWIEILSFSFGVSQPATVSHSSGGAVGAERANLQDFVVTKATDKASPKLFKSCCSGEHLDEVTLELCRATGDKQKYMQYKMKDVLVSSYQPGGSSGSETLPIESVSFNFGKIEIVYTETDHGTGKPKGDVTAGWDAKKNVAS